MKTKKMALVALVVMLGAFALLAVFLTAPVYAAENAKTSVASKLTCDINFVDENGNVWGLIPKNPASRKAYGQDSSNYHDIQWGINKLEVISYKKTSIAKLKKNGVLVVTDCGNKKIYRNIKSLGVDKEGNIHYITKFGDFYTLHSTHTTEFAVIVDELLSFEHNIIGYHTYECSDAVFCKDGTLTIIK